MSQANTAGWYPDPRDPRRKRYWDGDDWDGPSMLPPPTSPWTWVGRGVSGLIVAAILIGVGVGVGADGDVPALTIVAVLGYVVALASSIATAVGVIGAGVRLGIQHARCDEQ